MDRGASFTFRRSIAGVRLNVNADMDIVVVHLDHGARVPAASVSELIVQVGDMKYPG
jgi:hypothetical protein